MTNITVLSREIAMELQNISGAKINASDYLKIRKLAAKEIVSGLYDTKMVAPDFNHLEPADSPTLKVEPEKTANKEIVIHKPLNETPSWEPIDDFTNESDDFFSLCNKM